MYGKLQFSDSVNAIQDAVYRPYVKGYLYVKGKLGPVKFDRIDWDVTRRAMEMQ